MADSTQVREIVKRVQHPQIQDTVKAIEVRADLDRITYPEAANHLTATISKISEDHFSQNIYGVHTSGDNSGGNSCGGPGRT